MSEDTGNVKFVQNLNRETTLEKSLFWVEEPGCSSRTQNPAHQSADFSAKQGVTPGGNDLELFLGQSWVSSQKMGSVSRKTKKSNFFAFYQNPENIQRGDPWNKKNSKCSNLDKTCRTCGDHQKNKLGSDFEVFLHLVAPWEIKKESGYYWFLTTSTSMEAWPPVSGNLPPWRHGRPSQDKPKFQLAAQWSLVCSPHSQPGCI